MRVLHISAGNLYGGVETLLVTLAHYRHLCLEMEPEFTVCFEGRLSRELVIEGVPVHMLGEVRLRRPVSVRRARQRLTKLLLERRFDAVVCHMAWAQVVFGPVVRSARLPLVLWVHSATNGRHWLERWARRTRPDLALCSSHFVANNLKKLHLDLPTEMIYYPVAGFRSYGKAARQAIRTEFGTAADAVVIVQASRLEEWKGHQTLLEAFGQLHDMAGWTCWIVGGAQRAQEAHYLERLKLLSTRLGISERLRFVGQRSDIDLLLGAADIFCQPNGGPEPFGIVFIEALYAGLPVVATAIGGALEIVDESCGMLVPPGDANALAIAVKNLIGSSSLRGKLGSCGPAQAAKLCDPARQMDRLNSGLKAARNSNQRLLESSASSYGA
jgi:glycosyltransferase involved in cell wall biosynthesis